MSEYKKIIHNNKKARFNYSIESSFEAGIVLLGSEVKSIRLGKITIEDAYAVENNGELFLHNSYIAEYDKANRFNHQTHRPRKLLIHKKQLNKLIGKIKLKGYSLVPLSIYFNAKNIVKIELGLGSGKKQHDKRASIKEQDLKREQAAAMKKNLV